MNITHIHLPARFEKTLDELERSSGDGCKAAWLARDLIARMKNGEDPGSLPRQTRHGEQRIRNCRKFNLGSGYRLVSIQAGTHLFFEYVGSHDQCHLWLENNRGMVPVPAANERIVVVQPAVDRSGAPRLEILEDEYERSLMEKLDDKTLRMVFSGICCQQT
ncbi:hypothetical protein [Desulfoplanes sp.]